MWHVIGLLSLAALPAFGFAAMKHALNRTGRARKYFEFMGLALVLLVISASRSPGLTIPSPAPPPGSEVARQQAGPQEVAPLTVRFLDVGQGDAILVSLPGGGTMLVDAGPATAAKSLVSQLKAIGVRKVDFLVLTHPHEDHIGGAPAVMRSFEIGQAYMPRTSHTTGTYENLLRAMQDGHLTVTEAKAGVEVPVGVPPAGGTGSAEGDTRGGPPGLEVLFLGPTRTYDDLNDWSAVLSITYGKRTFVLMGDAGAAAEADMLAAKAIPKADVLKVGHHGSAYSTGVGLLRATSPSVAVISVGRGNAYSCPSDATLARLAEAGPAVYRTDIHGTVTVVTDGETLSVEVERAESSRLEFAVSETCAILPTGRLMFGSCFSAAAGRAAFRRRIAGIRLVA